MSVERYSNGDHGGRCGSELKPRRDRLLIELGRNPAPEGRGHGLQDERQQTLARVEAGAYWKWRRRESANFAGVRSIIIG